MNRIVVLAGALLLLGMSRGFGAACSYAIAPASASFNYNGGSGSLTVTVKAGCNWSAISTNDWIQTSSTGSGNGTATYSVAANPNAAPRTSTIVVEGQVHTVSQSGAPASLPVALGAPELVWETGTDSPWQVSTPPYPTFDGMHSGMSGNRFVHDSVSWLQTTVTGPGILTFWWKVDSDVYPPPPDEPYSFDALEFLIDDVKEAQIMGQVDWNYRNYVIPEGTHTVRWQYVKDPQYNLGEDRGWLDHVSFTPDAAAPSLAAALDTCGVDWSSGGEGTAAPWFSQTNVTHDGFCAVQSGGIYHYQTNWIRATVLGVTNVSFWWKVSSQPSADVLEFLINGAVVKQISGEVDWQSNSFNLSVITNTLTWRYRRDVMTTQGSNCGWLDQVVLSPSPELAIASYATNLTLTAGAEDCQAVLPDFVATGLFTLAGSCDSVTVAQTPPGGTTLQVGTTTVVLTATGPSGSSVTVTNTTVVADFAPPQLSMLGASPLTNECRTTFTDPGATAQDLCSGISSLTTNSTVNPDQVGVYWIDYAAVDGSGNSATNRRIVHVVDTTSPGVTLLGANPLTNECHTAFVDPGATALDLGSGISSVTTNSTVNPDQVGAYWIDYTAVDGSGNSGTNRRIVYVVDTTPPGVTLLGANPLTNECHTAFVDPGATAQDLGSGISALTTNSTVNPDQVGVYWIDYAAVDGSGNSATNRRMVYVVDTTPPGVTLLGPNPLTNECHTAFIDPGATAQDLGSGISSVTTNSTVNPDQVGAYWIDYTAVDGSGNSATNRRMVYVLDTTPPGITFTGSSPLVLAAEENCSATLPDLRNFVQVSDNCSPVFTVLQSPPAGTAIPLGTSTVVFAADDGNGNTNTYEAILSVEDQALARIETQPQSVTNLVGSTVQFTVTATACSTLTYQWLFQGSPIPGKTSAALTIGAVGSADAGEYSVVVSNSAGEQTSETAVLHVIPDSTLITGIEMLGGSGLQLTFTGPAGQSYTLLATENPGHPVATWTAITNGTFGATPEVVLDPAATNIPRRFYRIVSP